MGAVVPQSLRAVNAVAVDGHVLHEVPPALLEEVLAPLQPVEEEVPTSGGEALGVRVSSAVEVEGDVGVDAQGKVVVQDLHQSIDRET